jgi:hypothetical protein
MGPFLNNRNTIWEESIVRYLCVAIDAIFLNSGGIKGGEMPPPVQALKGGEITPDL